MFVGQVAYYELNIEYITEKFCENKEKPELKCNGKCHLAKELQLISTDTSTDTETPKISLGFETFSPLFFQVASNFLLNTGLLTDFSHKFYFIVAPIEKFNAGLLKPPIV